MAARILLALQQDKAGKAALAAAMGHKSVSAELHKQIKRLMEPALIEMTIPEKTNSHLQKYRLTAEGKRVVAGID